MKILMLISSLEVGGAETHVCSLSRALSSRGHEVYVASAGGALSCGLRGSGVGQFILPLDSHSPISLFLAYKRLCRLIEREDFDVLHAHSRISAYLCERLSKKYSVCFVTTVHAKFSCGRIKRRMSRWGYRSAAVSRDLAVYLSEKYGVARKNIEIIPNGIDTASFLPDRTGRERAICFMSRLDADTSRCAYSLCRIAPRLHSVFGIDKIYIIGGGGEHARVCEKAKRVNLRVGFPLIDVLGSVAEPSVYLAKSLVFVGVSRCALEAMSCAVPCVIAGDEGMLGALSFANISLAEQTNFCARGCGKISDGALEREISKLLLLGGKEYERLGRFLRRYVQEKHGIERMAERTEAFYIRARSAVSFGRGACLCGYYGYGNLGDDTLLECAILRAKKRFGQDSVSVLANAPVAEKYRRGVRCVSRKNVFSVIREIYSSHHLIFGGGTLFQDKTSMRSFLYYAAIAYIARLFGVRVEFWGAGFSPLEHRISRKLLSKILAFADYIELRDRDSLEVVLSLGAPRGKCYLSRDMAFDIPRPRATVEKREGGYAFIAVCGRQPRRSHAKIFIRAVGLMCEGKKIIVLGMYPREDREEGQRIARRLGARYVEAESAARLIRLLRRADVCCSERLHLLIFSAIAGVRFEGFGEDRKILSFCEEWGGRYCGGALR